MQQLPGTCCSHHPTIEKADREAQSKKTEQKDNELQLTYTGFGGVMFEKLDAFFVRYMGVADEGKAVMVDSIASFLEGCAKSVIAVIGILLMILSFPLWLIGRVSARE